MLYDFLVMNQFGNLFSISGLSLERLRTFLQVVEAGNISKAALGDSTKQSQFSRQIKEIESFFGVALTRRVGRRIEITEEGQKLALVIRRQFRELDDFRESMQGRSVTVRLGSQGSVIDWLVLPRIAEVHKTLGNALVEVEQMRTLEIVRAVADGRLDFGIVREDALPKKHKRWKLGKVGYALFAANTLWKGRVCVEDVIRNAPMIDLLPGGQFSTHWQAWLEKEKLRPKVIARVSSFTDVAKAVQVGYAAAVLPDLAALAFDSKNFEHCSIPDLSSRSLVLIANARSLDRAGLSDSAATKLATLLQQAFPTCEKS
jgi:DNA-binding transcriptional LysR family regulator